MAAGYNVNALELSPNYAGSIRGMASTIANIQGFLAPTIIALIIEDNVTPFSLMLTFFSSFCFFVAEYTWGLEMGIYISFHLLYHDGDFLSIFWLNQNSEMEQLLENLNILEAFKEECM